MLHKNNGKFIYQIKIVGIKRNISRDFYQKYKKKLTNSLINSQGKYKPWLITQQISGYPKLILKQQRFCVTKKKKGKTNSKWIFQL